MKLRESCGRLTTGLFIISGTALLPACTKGGDKASLPPPKPAQEESAAPAATKDQPTNVEVAKTASSVGEGAASQPSTAPSGTEAATGVSQPPASTQSANIPNSAPSHGVEPGRITPAPANDLGSAVDYRLTGEVDASRHSQVAFRVPGFLSSIAAKPGSLTKKGALLATLDDRDYVLRLELAKARREQARVGFDTAQRELKREMELKSANASTATVFEKVKAAADQAKLSLRLAELDVEGAELALKDTKLLAPYDSVVATQLKFEGENVPAGTTVYEVYDTSEPEITLTVPERLLGQVQVGTKLTITIPSAGHSGSAQIVRQVPVINEKTRTFRVTAKLDKYDPKIVPGLYAEGVLN